MMTCKEVHEFLMEYLDAELAEEVRATFEEHIGACPCCKNYLDTYKQTIDLTADAFEPCGDEPHPSLPEDLVAAVLAARKKRDEG